MNYTLLEVVQSVLGSMDSDAVSTIGETVESEQVALVAQEVFHDLATHQDIKAFHKMVQLEAQSNLDRPTLFRLPDNVTDVYEIRYKKMDEYSEKLSFEEVDFIGREDFLTNAFSIDTTENNVGEMVFEDNIRIPHYTDRDPMCWTTVDNQYILMDSLNNDYDSTLQNDKVLAWGYVIPAFNFEDDFVIPLPAKMLPTYLAEVKYTASPELRQVQNEIQGLKSKRGRRRNNMMGGITDTIDSQSMSMRSTRYGKGRNR